jgi:hypothetical protein
MTLGELCYTVRRTPADLECWAMLGALGDRWREPRDHGRWRHITKDVAARAIIMDKLLLAGVSQETAAHIAGTYVRKDHWPNDRIRAVSKGVAITVDLSDLELP